MKVVREKRLKDWAADSIVQPVYAWEPNAHPAK
jgi:hypothetical protein